MATREGIKAFLAGEVRAIGNGYVVSARLIATGTGDALITARETANDASGVVSAVDELSGQLRERIGESLRSIRADPPLEQVTTTSLEALRLYAQADKVSNEGDYRQAIALLKEAVGRDTNFAMAYRRLGMYETNPDFRAQMGEAGDSALRRAYALRGRLSERERYHVEAAYWVRAMNDPEKSATAYLALLDKYPNDAVALHDLAVDYNMLGRHAEERKTYREAISREGAFAVSYTNLLGALRRGGDTAQADTVLALFAKQFPTSPEVLQQRARLAGAKSDWGQVSRIADSARRSHPEIEVWAYNRLADMAELGGKLHDASRLHEEAIRRNARRLGMSDAERDFLIQQDVLERGMWYAEDRTAFAGRVEQAWRRNLALTKGRSTLNRRYPRFIYDLAIAGRAERAQQLYDDFLAGLDETTRDVPSFRNGAREGEALLAAARGQYRQAVTTLEAVRRDRPDCSLCDLIDIADVYDRAGQADSALAYFERYANTVGDRLDWDPAWLAHSLKRLGELYETKGDHAKAVEYYGKFLDQWKDADPELQPVVRDVKQRMARLAGEKP
jgi:tetratricopeptide (TPR) repeat protein